MILGYDASTSVVGFSFYDGTSVRDAGFIDISKLETNKEKIFHVISVMESNILMKEVTSIKLEAALSGYGGGLSSQQTIITLSRFNALFEYIISEHCKLPVILVNVMTARKKVLGKARVKGMTGKEYVAQQLPYKVPNLESFMKLNKHGNPDKKNEDIRDAIIISMS